MIDWDAHLLAPLHEVFGEEDIVFHPEGGEAYKITGIFDRAYTRDIVTVEGDAAMVDTQPILGVRDACFTSPPKKGDRVYITSAQQMFVIKSVQPDSQGGTRLELNKCKT